ncbi:MAG TPA: 30S ribosomal protein S20 [Candidatus Acidoferrales bacterium]|nr:30S ribosomal protein S20 [Candidatus Acidoferrales bacterium]
MPVGTPVKPKKKKKSILRNIRHAARRTVINRGNRTAVSTAVKKLRALVAAGKVDEARKLLPETYAILDRAIQHKSLHENTANRYKSRLALAIAAAPAAAPPAKAG